MPPVKNKWLFVISMVLVVVVLGFVANRVIFLASAKHAAGEVTSLSSSNSRCGGKHKYDCTNFSADVKYEVDGQELHLRVTAGSSRGHNRPLSEANYGEGSPVPILYNPRKPTQAYRDAFFDVWGAPLMTFFAQIGTLFGAFSEKRRRV